MTSSSPPDIPFLELGSSYLELEDEFDRAYRRVMKSGRYILGRELEAFESEFASYCGADHCVGVGSGLDALILSLRAMEISAEDEVLVPANGYIAVWLAVSHCGGTPVPVEPRADTWNIDPELLEARLTNRTKAVVAVHQYGQPADMDAIGQFATAHDLQVIEDAAQAHGACYRTRKAGSLARAAAFSFYPTKNLGAFGDGGAVLTSDPVLADRVRELRNYGSSQKGLNTTMGCNSRLDPLQAAFLRVRLQHLDEWNLRRAQLAKIYEEGLGSVAGLQVQEKPSWAQPSWHLYVARHRERERLRDYLASSGIQTEVHYPVPPHLSEVYRPQGLRKGDLPVTESLAETVFSLPLHPHLSASHVERTIGAIQGFR